MKSVNLIPKESRNTRAIPTGKVGPGHAVLAVLLIAVAFVSVYALTKNTVNDRQAKLTALSAEVSQAQALATNLQQYTSYEQAAEQRSSTVSTIIASRFEWATALDELSRVIPPGTNLSSLVGSVVPTASVGGGSGGGNTGSLRSDIAVPAFQLSGCTGSQDEVAELMSRLRLINGVTRVTLSDSQKAGNAAAGGATSSGACTPKSPTFDLVVFFTAVPNAGAEGIASAGTTGAVGVADTATPTTGGAQ
jgi:Tfp pilus assembly protein PilN